MKLFIKCFFIFLSLLHISFANEGKKRRPVPKLPEKVKEESVVDHKILERVDPHGKKEIKPTHEVLKSTNECLVCHGLTDSGFSTKPLKNETCFNCHNHAPHSGIEEHLKHKISCLDCHSVHRGQSINGDQNSEFNFGIKPQHKDIEPGFVNKKSTFPMLKKNCTDCHKL